MNYAIINTETKIVSALVDATSEEQAMEFFDSSVYFAKPCKSEEYEETMVNPDGKYAAPGWKYDTSSEKFYIWPCPRENFVLGPNMKWQAPTTPPGGFADPNVYHLSEEVSTTHKWEDDDQEWVARVTGQELTVHS